MKKILFIIVAIVAAVSFNSCKTSEKNYKAAYDITMHKKKAMEEVDSVTYSKILAEKKQATAIVDGDSVRLITEYVNIVDDSPSLMKKYNVIVGEYKQIFNARSFRDRLKAEKKPAYVVMDAKRVYYVVAQGFDTSDEAAKFLHDIHKTVKMHIPIENPWILKRP